MSKQYNKITRSNMSWVTEILSINYITVAVATITSYVFGFAWYHWAVFGEAWANSLGITKEQADNTEGLGGAFVISLISGLLKTLCLAMLMAALNISGFLSGLFFGAVIAVIFIVTSLGYYDGFARVSPKLTLINAAHSIIELTLIGTIIGALS
ncbi:DUF1761 domain-containing protein [Aliikangiella maris]|uniref:DUF1761 domain-containing protein n=2 Tax=Aliikangiella maris TaxID=3162458 RepID=A0ABV2BZP9_9GAMM